MIRELYKKLLKKKIGDFGAKIDGAKKHLAKFELGLKQGKMPSFKPKQLSDAGLSNLAIATIIILKKNARKHYQKRAAIEKITDIVIGATDEETIGAMYSQFESAYRIYPSAKLVSQSSIEDVALLSNMLIHEMRGGYKKVIYKISRKELYGDEKIYEVNQDEADTLFKKYLKKINEVKQIEKDNPNKPKTKKKKLNLYTVRRDGHIVMFAKIASRKYVELRTFDSLKEVNEFLQGENKDAGMEELRKILAEKQKQPTTRTLENLPRSGVSRRDGDITTDSFHEAYPFRGVQFGNWVNQKERQANINKAYDALADLGSVVGMNGKAITFGGDLALAFGARGKGGKNAPMAHYEPAQNVINLTKKNGAGTLAHEWFHGFDMFVGRQSGAVNYFSEIGAVLDHKFDNALKTMNDIKDSIRSMDFYTNSKEYDGGRSKNYWSTDVELLARAFESHVSEKLRVLEVSNGYLVNYIDGSEVYPSKEDLKILSPLFEKFIMEAKYASGI